MNCLCVQKKFVCNEYDFHRFSSMMERTVSALPHWVERRPTREESML